MSGWHGQAATRRCHCRTIFSSNVNTRRLGGARFESLMACENDTDRVTQAAPESRTVDLNYCKNSGRGGANIKENGVCLGETDDAGTEVSPLSVDHCPPAAAVSSPTQSRYYHFSARHSGNLFKSQSNPLIYRAEKFGPPGNNGRLRAFSKRLARFSLPAHATLHAAGRTGLVGRADSKRAGRGRGIRGLRHKTDTS